MKNMTRGLIFLVALELIGCTSEVTTVHPEPDIGADMMSELDMSQDANIEPDMEADVLDQPDLNNPDMTAPDMEVDMAADMGTPVRPIGPRPITPTPVEMGHHLRGTGRQRHAVYRAIPVQPI